MHKMLVRAALLLSLLVLAVAHRVSAQELSGYFGLGTATNGPTTTPGCPSKTIFDDFTGNCEPAHKMGGVFGVFGADYMLREHLGFNAEYAFRFAQASYLPEAGLNARPAFYDFNAVYQPGPSHSRIVPVLTGGVGGAKVSLYFNQQACAISNVCNSQSQFIGSANHFQVHGAVGVKIYVTPALFIKPQFDAHYVHNLDQQYERNFVPIYTVSVGYTFGRR